MKIGYRPSLGGARRSAGLFLKSRLGVVGLTIILFFVGMAVFAPQLSEYDPVFDTAVGAPYSYPGWVRLLPQYADVAETGYLIPEVDFLLGDGPWAFSSGPGATVTRTSTSETPPPSLAYSEKINGSLLIDVTATPTGTAGTPALPGGQVFFSMTQQFDVETKPPSVFLINAKVEPLVMSNVSAIYLNFRISGPTGEYTLSTVNSNLLASQIRFTQSQAGVWRSATVDGRLLPTSGIPEFRAIVYPAKLIFKTPGLYNLTMEVQAVPTGDNPQISIRVGSLSLKFLGGTFGLLGTDNMGRDVWSEFVWGSRISILIGFFSGVGSVILGTVLGIASGYLGGFWDEAMGRITDFVLVLPFLPLLIVISLIFSQNPYLVKTIYAWVIFLFTILSWPVIARIIRSQVLTIKERQYVEASRALGAGTGHILRRHLLPNVTGLVYSQVALSVAGFILLEAALDFITVDLYPSTVTTWGLMLTQSLPDALINATNDHVWWWFYPPGIAIAALSLAFVLVGFALDSIFNPRLRAR